MKMENNAEGAADEDRRQETVFTYDDNALTRTCCEGKLLSTAVVKVLYHYKVNRNPHIPRY